MNRNDFHFCYSKRVSSFLSFKGINYIMRAVNPSNNKIFSLYLKDDQLKAALNEYNQLHSIKEA